MGRWSHSHRGVIEWTPGLTIDDLKKWGFMTEGYKSGILTLSRNGKKTGSLGIEVEIQKGPFHSYIQFNYLLDKKPIEYFHVIELFPCYFGGHRFYFRCRNCGKRTTALYLSRGYYSCRHCHRLVYICSRRHRALNEKIDRANYWKGRAEKQRKWGHPKKANQLLVKTKDLEDEAWAGLGLYVMRKIGYENVCP